MSTAQATNLDHNGVQAAILVEDGQVGAAADPSTPFATVMNESTVEEIATPVTAILQESYDEPVFPDVTKPDPSIPSPFPKTGSPEVRVVAPVTATGSDAVQLSNGELSTNDATFSEQVASVLAPDGTEPPPIPRPSSPLATISSASRASGRSDASQRSGGLQAVSAIPSIRRQRICRSFPQRICSCSSLIT